MFIDDSSWRQWRRQGLILVNISVNEAVVFTSMF